ncbi:glycosyltransferase [Conexibacter arvalis]|uniref:GT2 family glycosyltransferase n=1 Tax=Conexibacter arvalis TaxID=912552 RepID=A0A840I9G4_9ACTN|nr:glycosyltransferase [Conexibacter arvalis]MBB4661506.1 GT2 family glycosyltransferase [Conexibacter arvalis]
MRADIVVVTWHGREVLASCLEHLERQTERHRVIVVDNASGDGTAELVGERFPHVTFVELPENRGFGAAVNAGAAVGDGEAIVLVNNDVDADPGFVAALLAPLRGDARVGMVAGMTLMPGREAVDAFGIQLDAGLAAYNRLRHASPAEAENAGLLAGPSGGAAAYRRAAFDAVGGFDETLIAYGEDVDLLLRLRAAGWKAAAAPAARGVHLGGATIGVDSPQQRWLSGFARGFLLRRWGVLRSRSALHALTVDALVIGWGVARHRTLSPLRSRVAGWRAAGRGSRLLPAGAVDESIRLVEAVRRLRSAR